MCNSRPKLPQRNAGTSRDDYLAMRKRVVQYILDGKTKEEAEILGGVKHHLIETAYSTVRPWALPSRNQFLEASNTPGIPSLSEKQQQVWEMTQRGMTQKEIAKELKCSQSKIAFTLKQARLIKEEASNAISQKTYVDYRTRIHLFVHGMDLWEKVKGVCLGSEDFAKDIEEAISLNMSEVISPYLSYSPRQLDKLVMDIVLATEGRCTIIADCFAVNAITDVHAIYFIRDCIYTKSIPANEENTSRRFPVNCPINYLDDWIRYLGISLSENDEETVRKFNFWRDLFDAKL